MGEAKVDQYKFSFEIVNPKFSSFNEVSTEPDISKNNKNIEVDYPTINKTSGNHIEHLIKKIPLDFFKLLPEFLPLEIKQRRSLMSLGEAFLNIHAITEDWNQKQFQAAQQRLVYEELFWDQLKIKLLKINLDSLKCPPIQIAPEYLRFLTEQLEFSLTCGQNDVIKSVLSDLKSGRPMSRLIQGDVGCGKTIVAVLVTYLIVNAGYQGALLCPTEGLAQQIYNQFIKFNPSGFSIDIILGGGSQKTKKEQLLNLATGKTQIIVGTHAILQNKVEFKNLGLTIIDEQHKFGVNQRNVLVSKSKLPHFLLMSATPIPRSLGLTLFGHLDISSIKEGPNKNKVIHTKIITQDLKFKMLSFILTRIQMGEQAYLIVPLVEESEHLSLNNLMEVYKQYECFFPQVKKAFLHGKMSSEEKNSILNSFKGNDISLLISTTVIEVGIDVPNATVVTIYNPERFGLSSLHQMRGRVGRGSRPGFCFLECTEGISFPALQRLQQFLKCRDGFEISELDLKLRGPGDYVGTDQSGHVIKKKFANPQRDYKILLQINQDIDNLSRNYPQEFNRCKSKVTQESNLSPI